LVKGIFSLPFDLEVDWQSLVNGVGGHELLEWQGKAIGSFKTDATQHQHVFQMSG